MQVEVYTAESDREPAWIGEFSFLPRQGEYLSVEVDGYFQYLNVIEVWHRQCGTGQFMACLKVALDD